jgi:hypothetical protein
LSLSFGRLRSSGLVDILPTDKARGFQADLGKRGHLIYKLADASF